MNTKKGNNFVDSDKLYEAAYQPRMGFLKRILYWAWVVTGLAALLWFAWAEPFSGQLFDYLLAQGIAPWLISLVGIPLVMLARAVLVVEAFGYVYHRFFQHVGFFTRTAQVFRRNQKFHWIHHMVIYPIGRFYQRGKKYYSAEKGIGLSWFIPGILAALLFVLTHGFNLGSVVFVLGLYFYAKHVVDLAHARFHLVEHPWAEGNYFHWLEDIHLLHHWDQRTNFTIVHPLMDVLFGTYLSPKKHQAELRIALEDHELTASDLINWRYLLIEATPAERAAFVSVAWRHRPSKEKLAKLISLLEKRTASHPDDAAAADLLAKAVDLQELALNPTPAVKGK